MFNCFLALVVDPEKLRDVMGGSRIPVDTAPVPVLSAPDIRRSPTPPLLRRFWAWVGVLKGDSVNALTERSGKRPLGDNNIDECLDNLKSKQANKQTSKTSKQGTGNNWVGWWDHTTNIISTMQQYNQYNSYNKTTTTLPSFTAVGRIWVFE
jgi:hypothetical protein